MPDKRTDSHSHPAFRSLATAFALLYFVQGMTEPTEGLLAQPLRATLRTRGASPTEVGFVMALIAVPWMFKPIYGLITDFIPLWGARRRSYLLATTLLTAAALHGLALLNPAVCPLWLLGLAVLIPTAAVAFSDVVVDAVMVEEGRRTGWTGSLQAVQWAAASVAGIVTGLWGGWAAQQDSLHGTVIVAAELALVAWLAVWSFIREPPLPAAFQALSRKGRIARGVRELTTVFRQPAMLVLIAFMALWNFNPFAANVLQEHMTRHWGWSEWLYGETVSWQAGGCVVGSLAYAPFSRRMPVTALFHAAVLSGALSTAFYVLVESPFSARVISVIVGAAYMFGSLAQLDLAARLCQPATAGTTFSVLMAVANISLAASTAAGGAGYDLIARRAGAPAAFSWLVWIGTASTAACWLLTPLLNRSVSLTKADDAGRASDSDS